MYKKCIIFAVATLLLLSGSRTTQAQTPREEIDMTWWKESKFGLFIHWGLYSYAGCQWKGKSYSEFMQHSAKIPIAEMKEFAKGFNPTEFNAEEWVLAAKNAGMKYLVITSKHHEGFAMYDSPSDDYNIVKGSAFKRDPLKELSDACDKYGLKFCVYYSLGRDWADPDVPSNWPRVGGRSNDWDWPDEENKEFARYFERKVKPQMIELLTQYNVHVVWFDTHGACTPAQSQELIDMIQHYRPGCLINDRVGNNLGDFITPEQTVISEIRREPWESCITLGRSWGFNPTDSVYKSSEVLVRLLVDIAAKGGNLLLNVGPTGLGEFTPMATERLATIGSWMKINGEAIYGTEPWRVYGESFTPEKISTTATDNLAPDAIKDETAKGTEPDIRFSTKGNTVYIFARSWKGDKVRINDLYLTPEESIKSITLLGYKGKINYAKQGNGLELDLPSKYRPEVPVYVYKVELQ